MKIKYLIFDVVKVVLPIVAAQLLPEGAPDAAIITTILYALALILGIDSAQKTIRAAAE